MNLRRAVFQAIADFIEPFRTLWDDRFNKLESRGSKKMNELGYPAYFLIIIGVWKVLTIVSWYFRPNERKLVIHQK